MIRAGKACLALQRRLASGATSAAVSSTQSTPVLRQGDVLAGGSWTVRRAQALPDLGIAAVEMDHVHSTAKFLHLAPIDDVSDPTNVFSVAFRTTPSDSTGVSHILEHVTLCGSQKYPVRDPFFKMLSRSLSTFMNAMTG
jgi:Zn-dependent M16 (insulinase) family peptidase